MSIEPNSSVMTVDVEEWFHILDLDSTPSFQDWGKAEARVEAAFYKILDLAHQHGIVMTCFFLGWIAEKYPRLVRDAVKAGHEIASHGYAHELIFQIGRERFAQDIGKAKSLLEDISGTEVRGYRAPGFSCVEQTPWVFDEIRRSGYSYDSSIFPAARAHGGMPGESAAPFLLSTAHGDLVEFPVSTVEIFGKRVCMFGGGYLRLFPKSLIYAMSKRVRNSGRPVIYYIHPREVDPSHPRLPMPLGRRFKSYVGLEGVMPKLDLLMRSFPFVRFCDLEKQIRAAQN